MPDPLIIDPALQASVIRQFNLRGELSPFLLTNRVVPTFDIGTLVTAVVPTVVTTQAGSTGVRIGTLNDATAVITSKPGINDNDVTDGGTSINPAALTVLVDTGPIVGQQGQLWFYAIIGANVPVDFRIEWRNAADAATVAAWTILVGGPSAVPFAFELNLEDMQVNERIRIVNVGAVVGTVSSNIAFRRFGSADVA